MGTRKMLIARLSASTMLALLSGVASAQPGDDPVKRDDGARSIDFERVITVSNLGKGSDAEIRARGDADALRCPNGVGAAPSGKLIAIADSGNHRIVAADRQGKPTQVFGAFGEKEGQFNLPGDVAVDSTGSFYVADTMNHRIQVFSADGKFQRMFGGYGTGDGQLNAPHGLAIDERTETIFVTDTMNHRVVRFGLRKGDFKGAFGRFGSNRGELRFPHGIAVAKDGSLYIADFVNHRIVHAKPEGQIINTWGGFGSGAGQLQHPWGVDVDGNGNVYVGDMSNHRVQVFGPAGRFVGSFGKYAAEGAGGGFDHPKDVAVVVDGARAEEGRGQPAAVAALVVAQPGAHAVDVFRVLTQK